MGTENYNVTQNKLEIKMRQHFATSHLKISSGIIIKSVTPSVTEKVGMETVSSIYPAASVRLDVTFWNNDIHF